MNCPEHPDDELRQEGDAGFCLKCLKHYALCTSVRYMEMCSLLKGHEGQHVGSHGHTWTVDDGRGGEV